MYLAHPDWGLYMEEWLAFTEVAVGAKWGAIPAHSGPGFYGLLT